MSTPRDQLSEDSFEKRPVLLVEDTMADTLLLTKAFEMLEIANPVRHIRDGEQAVDYLGSLIAKDFQDPLLVPVLIILDIKLPKLSGLSVLQQVKRNERLKKIPVIILTTSDQATDVNLAYEYGANAYLIKPIKFSEFIKTIAGFKTFWLELNQFPLLSM